MALESENNLPQIRADSKADQTTMQKQWDTDLHGYTRIKNSKNWIGFLSLKTMKIRENQI